MGIMAISLPVYPIQLWKRFPLLMAHNQHQTSAKDEVPLTSPYEALAMFLVCFDINNRILNLHINILLALSVFVQPAVLAQAVTLFTDLSLKGSIG